MFACFSHYQCVIHRLLRQESILCVNNQEQHRDSSSEYDLKWHAINSDSKDNPSAADIIKQMQEHLKDHEAV